jgi:hypothetical protein
MKKVLFRIIIPMLILAVWIIMCYPVCAKADGFDYFLYWIMVGCPYGIRKMSMFLVPKNLGIAGSIGILALDCIIGGLIGGMIVIIRIINTVMEIIKLISGTFGHNVQKWKGKCMESMRDVNRVMEREIKKGSSPLKLDHIEFGDYSYQEIMSQEKLFEVLTYLLRIGDFKQYAGKNILNNVYMDLRWKKPVFKRTKTAMERNNIFVTIRRYLKKLKPQYNGDVYLETVRCYFDISQENLEKCRYTYQGNETYAFLMSDKYIMALYTHCLVARKEVAMQGMQIEGFTEKECGMVKFENVRDVLFQVLLLDNVKLEDDKVYAELCTIFVFRW